MAATHEGPAGRGGSSRAGVGPVWRVTEAVLGIIGLVCLALGLVILVGGENQWIGLGGDLSWRVGDLPAELGFGLLIGGAVVMMLTLVMVVGDRGRPAQASAQGARTIAELGIHAVIFAIVNAFLWVQDIVAGGGLEYAYWTTIPWGIGLIVHAAVYLYSRSQAQRPHG